MAEVETPAPESAAGEETLRAELAAELETARRRTLALAEPVDDGDLAKQHSPLMSPIAWDLAHVGYFEELWLVRRVGGLPPLAEHGDLYDALSHARSERGELPILDPGQARAYLDAVRARTLDVLWRAELDGDDPLLADGFVYRMIVQHEQQHCETMLVTLQLREDAAYPLAPAALPAPRAPAPAEDVVVAGGVFPLGVDHDPWAYDNERPAHEVELPAFRIDTVPVDNRAYLRFVEDGGYDDPHHWSEDGWTWRVETGAEHPQFWKREGEGSWSRVRFGHREPLPLDEPVQHVCWHEADAFARWAGKRLPTEEEWERAASWEASEGKRRYPWGDERPGDEHANLGGARLGPAPVASYPAGASREGVLQLTGDVWEWTSSDFRAYPGFAAFPYAQYSQVFFGDGSKVLRGGSWATHPLVARTTFRNWDFPIRRQIFAGFRCARDA
jgi:iron(II)-dependent oxidoreductase